jgi:hypothetical protein
MIGCIISLWSDLMPSLSLWTYESLCFSACLLSMLSLTYSWFVLLELNLMYSICFVIRDQHAVCEFECKRVRDNTSAAAADKHKRHERKWVGLAFALKLARCRARRLSRAFLSFPSPFSSVFLANQHARNVSGRHPDARDIHRPL